MFGAFAWALSCDFIFVVSQPKLFFKFSGIDEFLARFSERFSVDTDITL